MMSCMHVCAVVGVSPARRPVYVPQSKVSCVLQPKSLLTKHNPQSMGRKSVVVRATDEEEEVDVEMIELDAEERMEKTTEVAQMNFNKIKTGRANPAMVSELKVDYYGAPTPLQQLASISVPDGSTLLLKPFDKGSIGDIERAIQSSDIGIPPNNDGEKIRLVIPQLTEERRKEMSKKVSQLGEEAKVAVRNVRRDALKQAGKAKVSEDMMKGVEQSIQKLTDSYIQKVNDMVADKTKELTTI